jgi:hypothetical protein
MDITPIRVAALATSIAAGLTGFVVTAQPASAASKFQIAKVHFDSAGSDTPVTNAKLNDEYVVVTNTDTVAHKIGGWRLRDAANHLYVFPSGATLGAKKSVVVRTGKGTDTAANRYMNRGYYVWNNDKDTAYLRDAKNAGGDTCSWKTSDPGSTKIC